MTGYIGLFDTAPDYNLEVIIAHTHTQTHTHTSVHSHVYNAVVW
jgi:hypothetical protein